MKITCSSFSVEVQNKDHLLNAGVPYKYGLPKINQIDKSNMAGARPLSGDAYFNAIYR